MAFEVRQTQEECILALDKGHERSTDVGIKDFSFSSDRFLAYIMRCRRDANE